MTPRELVAIPSTRLAVVVGGRELGKIESALEWSTMPPGVRIGKIEGRSRRRRGELVRCAKHDDSPWPACSTFPLGSSDG